MEMMAHIGHHLHPTAGCEFILIAHTPHYIREARTYARVRKRVRKQEGSSEWDNPLICAVRRDKFLGKKGSRIRRGGWAATTEGYCAPHIESIPGEMRVPETRISSISATIRRTRANIRKHFLSRNHGKRFVCRKGYSSCSLSPVNFLCRALNCVISWINRQIRVKNYGKSGGIEIGGIPLKEISFGARSEVINCECDNETTLRPQHSYQPFLSRNCFRSLVLF